ncbi:chemotaxis protein CheC [Sporolactobacillus sp. THM7-7]|nr:chemotaxis protein CheC [Sporolactobacillus sp. THM7-7]
MTEKDSREDILKELFNIGVGQAAGTLSDIIDKKIVLNVPSVKILDIGPGRRELEKFLSQVASGAVMVSIMSFNHQLQGVVSLIFPAEKMHRFIDLCLHEERTETTMGFTDIDYDTIKEVGNIVLNAIIGELSNMIRIPVTYTLPEVCVLDHARAEHFMSDYEYRLILIIMITFDIEGTEIEGAIVVNMTLKSLEDILNAIDGVFHGR